MVGIFKTLTFMVLIFASASVFASDREDYDVGDDFEWNRPPTPMFYTTWAARKIFHIGDELDFDFEYGRSDVAVVTKEAYEDCIKENPIMLMTVPTVTIRLNTTGPQYYISTIGDNCLAGQKLTVTVTGRGPGREDYDVGDDFDWNRPPTPMFYSTWAARKIFRVGDELDFDFDYGRSDVATVTKEAFESCTKEDPISLMTVPTVTIRLNTTGPQYYISTIGNNCLAGQKLTVNVTGPGGMTPGTGRGVTTPAPKASPGPAVGGPTAGVTTGTGIQTGNAGALLSTGVTFLVAFVSAIVVMV